VNYRPICLLACLSKVFEVLRTFDRIQKMDIGQVTVLVLLDFSQASDMNIHGLLVCNLKNLQNYLDGHRMLVDTYLNGRTKFVKCGEKFFNIIC
jgi:hypothetical protein